MALPVLRRIADRLRTRDPDNDGARRAMRAALALPVAALLTFLVAGHTQATVFTLVGSIALLIVTDFPGTIGTRALAFCGLGVTGVVLITLGTLAAPHPWIAVPLCFAVGAVTSFVGLLSEIIAAGQRATLILFLLPLCLPVGALDNRLLGWLLALAVCVPAALLVFPPRYSTELRDRAARVCTALADRIEGGHGGHDNVGDEGDPAAAVTAAMDALRREMRGSALRSTTLTAGGRGLIRVVSNLQWLSDNVGPATAEQLGSIRAASVGVLRDSAAVLVAGDAAGAAALAGIVADHRVTAFRQYADDIDVILGEPDDAVALRRGRALLGRRTLSATIGLTGSIIATATATDARPIGDRLLGRGLPETGIADRVPTRRTALTGLPGYLTTRSITVLNSLRTGLVLALAFAMTLVLPVQNALWVVLGALAVLRSSASTTRTSVLGAVGGTIVGLAAGAALIALVGIDPVVLWCLLPAVTFIATYVMRVGSFGASQAMFTMQVLIVFNLIQPTGWQIGLIRLEDVVLGALVGLVASVLLWPGGAQAAVRRAIDEAVAATSRYLSAAVFRVTRGPDPRTDQAVAELGADSRTAALTHGDAVRVYLTETNGAIDPALIEDSSRIPRLRVTADLIADITPPPAGLYPRTRTVLEEHTDALCARLEGRRPARSAVEIGDEFVSTLRAEAGSTPGAADAALPLVTVAANIGELELTYPDDTGQVDAAARSAEHR